MRHEQVLNIADNIDSKILESEQKTLTALINQDLTQGEMEQLVIRQHIKIRRAVRELRINR